MDVQEDQDAPKLVIDNNGGSPILRATSSDLGQLGDVELVLDACLTIDLSGEKNCIASEPIEITVVDPCLTTTIVTADLATIM